MRNGIRWFCRVSNSRGRPYYGRSLLLEELEGRLVPATTFTQNNLVSDIPGIDRKSVV